MRFFCFSRFENRKSFFSGEIVIGKPYLELFVLSQIQVAAKRIHNSVVERDQADVLRLAGSLQELEHEGLLGMYGLLNDQGDLTMVGHNVRPHTL